MVSGKLDVRWNHGSPSAKHDRDPEIQVHHYDEHTVILRQNMAVHYEAPFLYLLLGDDQAVLVDSGATPQHGFFPLRATVDRLLADWLAEHPRTTTSWWWPTPTATATTPPGTCSSPTAPTPPCSGRTWPP